MTSHQETEKNGRGPRIYVGVTGSLPTQDEDAMTPAGHGSNQGLEGSFGITGSSSKGTCRNLVKGEEGVKHLLHYGMGTHPSQQMSIQVQF